MHDRNRVSRAILARSGERCGGDDKGRNRNGKGTFSGRTQALTPDDTFLVHEIVDDFDAVTQLKLCLLGHR